MSEGKQNIVNEDAIQHLLQKDAVFGQIHKQYGNPPDWKRPEGFESLVQIILEQQVSLASAKAHFEKLKAHVGEIKPKNILLLSDQEMRGNHISRQKASYLRALSEAVLEMKIKLHELRELSEPEVRSQMTKIKGIGNWTADVYLLSCLQSKDIFPIGDVALVNAIRELTDLTSKEDILSHADKWRPHRSLATYFFWHYYLSKRGKVIPSG